MRVAVRAMVERRADVIKVMMTQRAGLIDTDFRARVLSDDEVAAAVDEATKAGLPVAAHAHTDEAARVAVRTSVRTIEHGTLMWLRRLSALMRDKGTCFAPTLSFWVDMLEPGGEYNHATLAARAQEMLPVARAAVAQATKERRPRHCSERHAVRRQAASSASAHEVAELARSGMSPMAARSYRHTRSARHVSALVGEPAQ